MPSKKSNMSLQQTSESSSSATATATSRISASAKSSGIAGSSPFISKSRNASPIRSFTVDSGLSKSKVQSVDQKPQALQRSKTAPTPIKPRQNSSPTGDMSNEAFFQKRVKEKGSLDHYGRHTNGWLFGGWGIRETAKGFISRKNSH